LFYIVTSQSSVAMHLRCDGNLIDYFITCLLLSHTLEIVLKIGQHLAKSWATVGCPVF